MARTPRAKVPKTTGQGISRLGYQKGYALRNPDAPKVEADFSVAKGTKPGNYAKSGGKSDAKINVDFGRDLVGELPDIPPKSAVRDSRSKGKALK